LPLLGPQELAAIVPDCYAEFRPIVADGLTFFLQQLPASRLAEVFQAQANLPADAGLSRRLVVFLHACPALHKLAQVIARDRHLDPELRRHLQELESLEPHTPVEQWQPTLARELAPAAEEYRICISERPLAEGSVAVVVPLTWSAPLAGSDRSRQRGVAKLLKPGIRERLDEDLCILGRLADHLDECWAAYGLSPLAYRETLEDVARLLTDEVQLRLEQAHLRRAGSQFAGQSDLQVPQLLPFCTDAVTAMERVDGRKVTDPQAVQPWQRPMLFRTVVRGLLARVLFTRDGSVLFHGDPHAGNLLVTHDGRVAILDWGLAGQLTVDDRVQTSQLLLGAWALDGERVAGAIAALVGNGAHADVIHRHVEAALAEVRGSRLPGPAWAMGLLDTLARAGVRFPPRLLLFRKTLLTLEGVLSDVYPGGSLEAALMAEALTQFAWEWPLRWWKPPDDCDYGTHVSSADLVYLALRLANRSTSFFRPQRAPRTRGPAVARTAPGPGSA
jgi:ubiquinone biosynthesis protein